MLNQSTIQTIQATVPVLAEHGKTITTVFYRNLFTNYPELQHLFNQTNQLKGRQQGALANTVYAAAANIENLPSILPAIMPIAHKHRSLGVTPEQYAIVGEQLLRAIQEVLGEAATPEIMEAWEKAYGVIASIFIDLEEELYVKAEQQPYGWRFFKPFIVKDRVQENDHILSLYLQPADGQAVPSFLPGQYITLQVQIPGQDYLCHRQYTLSQAPTGESFRISVKKDEQGSVSSYLHEQVTIGQELQVSAPAGLFHLPLQHEPTLTFISGGVGITPMMSMVQSIMQETNKPAVHFIHSSRTLVRPFHQELKQLATQEQFYYHATQTATEPRITANQLKEQLPSSGPIFLCGPPRFMAAMQQAFKQLQVAPERVHLEFFGPALP